MHTYQYTGDLPTVFISLQCDGETWEPNKGDVITVDEPIAHPLLEEVIVSQAKVEAEAEAPTKQQPTEPAKPVKSESPVTVDAQEEN